MNTLLISIKYPDADPAVSEATHDALDVAGALLGVALPTDAWSAKWAAAPVQFALGDVPAALAAITDGEVDQEALDEYACDEYDSPGKAIEEIVARVGDEAGAIVCPDGYRIMVDVLTFDSDPDMLLVRVSGPGHGGSFSTYAQDWDDLVPRSFLGAEMTVELITEVLDGIVDEANRAMEAAGL